MGLTRRRLRRLERAFDPGITPGEALARFHNFIGAVIWTDVLLPGQNQNDYPRDPQSYDELEMECFQHERRHGQTSFTTLSEWREDWIQKLSF